MFIVATNLALIEIIVVSSNVIGVGTPSFSVYPDGRS